MTGQNKYVLSIFAKMRMTDPDQLRIALENCSDLLNVRDARHMTFLGIPVIRENIKTKDQLLEYILNEVKTFVPEYNRSTFRRAEKEIRVLERIIRKGLKIKP